MSLKSYKVGWKDVIIGFLLGMIVAMAHLTHAQTVGGVVSPLTPIKPETVLKVPQMPLESQLASIPVAPTPTISCGDNPYLAYIYQHESGCSTTAENPSGAYGLCQSLPGNKMAAAGADWQSSWATQNAWCVSYCSTTYGSPYNCWQFWLAHHWW